MKSLYSYECKIEDLNRKKRELEKDEFWAIMFELPALLSARAREIKIVEEKIRMAEEEKWDYVKELTTPKEYPKIVHPEGWVPKCNVVMEDPFHLCD